MVPYVRKSYYKYIRDGLKYMGDSIDYKSFCGEYEKIRDDASVSIVNSDWNKYFGTINIPKTVYKYALEMTEKEVKQAVEGMLHNLK